MKQVRVSVTEAVVLGCYEKDRLWMALGLWITVVDLVDGLRAAPSRADGATEADRRSRA